MDEHDEEPRPEPARWFVFRPSRKKRLTAAQHRALADAPVERC